MTTDRNGVAAVFLPAQPEAPVAKHFGQRHFSLVASHNLRQDLLRHVGCDAGVEQLHTSRAVHPGRGEHPLHDRRQPGPIPLGDTDRVELLRRRRRLDHRAGRSAASVAEVRAELLRSRLKAITRNPGTARWRLAIRGGCWVLHTVILRIANRGGARGVYRRDGS